MGFVAVQISARHYPMPDHGAVWTLFLMLAGVGLVAVGARSALRRRRWRGRAQAALGRIVDHVSQRHRRPAAPVVEFAVGDRTVMFCAPTGRGDPYRPVGEAVGILFDPVDPRRAMLADSDPGGAFSWPLVAGLFVLGVFTAVAVG